MASVKELESTDVTRWCRALNECRIDEKYDQRIGYAEPMWDRGKIQGQVLLFGEYTIDGKSHLDPLLGVAWLLVSLYVMFLSCYKWKLFPDSSNDIICWSKRLNSCCKYWSFMAYRSIRDMGTKLSKRSTCWTVHRATLGIQAPLFLPIWLGGTYHNWCRCA